MKVYIAGPMRNIPQSNFPAFFDAALKLRAIGHEVFSPVEWDIEHGFSYDGVPPEGFSIRAALAADLAFLCHQAELVAVLPGWHNSRGAGAEIAAAQALDIPVKMLKAVLDEAV